MFRYLEERQKAKNAEENRVRVYTDIAITLWYKVGYEDVLSYKKSKMETQSECFMLNRWGNNNLIYGPIKALTSEEDKKKFKQVAEAELRDKGYGDLKVHIYPGNIIVSK